MDVLYLSHCVPNPPDKGEKIRAFHEVAHLAGKHRVHLACFARNQDEEEAGRALSDRCASVYVEPFHSGAALARAAVRFAAGACLTPSFYFSRRMRHQVNVLAAAENLSATVVYSSAMAQYAPSGIPMLLDMVDVDSEKWEQYSRLRHPGFAFAVESRRLRNLERVYAARARCTFLSTRHELDLFRKIAPDARLSSLENGVDLEFFDPSRSMEQGDLQGRRFLVFVGVMDYYPNVNAACWFAQEVFPELWRRDPLLEFLIVGRSPAAAVSRLAQLPGVTVTGGVPDVRPYLAASLGCVTPLRIARGIQNKVLEALAMGKTVLASDAVCKTFGGGLPVGVVRCGSAEAFIREAAGLSGMRPDVRRAAGERFSWRRNLALLSRELERSTQKCHEEEYCSSATYFRPPAELPSSVR